jgi:hypothetical protein
VPLIGLNISKKEVLCFKELAYWDFETVVVSCIQYMVHELHPTDLIVIFDTDDNPVV